MHDAPLLGLARETTPGLSSSKGRPFASLFWLDGVDIDFSSLHFSLLSSPAVTCTTLVQQRNSPVHVVGILACTGSITDPRDPSLLFLRNARNKNPYRSETQNLGKGVLYTCALRPGILYGTGKDE